jgi:hypothetical protein
VILVDSTDRCAVPMLTVVAAGTVFLLIVLLLVISLRVRVKVIAVLSGRNLVII